MTSTHPAAGVVVLNYNSHRHTLACLASLDKLSPRADAVVVVDNRSTDDSVARLRAERPDVELIVNEVNGGFAQGNNIGIRRLLDRGVSYVWLLNNDATADPGALRAMVALAEGDATIGAVGSVIHHAQRPDAVQAWGGGGVCRWTGHTRAALRADQRVDYLTGASLLLRAAALAQVGLLDERYFFQWEDADICLRLRERGWKIAVAEGSKVWHEGGGSDPGLSPFRVRHHAAGLVRFMRAHAPLPALTTLPMFAYYTLASLRQRSLAPLRAAGQGWREGWRG